MGFASSPAFLETLPIAAYACDADGRITGFNQRAVQLWGRIPKLNDAQDRFCGAFRLHHADGSLLVRERCCMAIALQDGREHHDCKIIVERPDGSRRAVLASVSPFFDASGRLAGAMNVLVDVTEQERATKFLHRQNSLLELIATKAPLADILGQIVATIEEQSPGVFCSILLLEPDGIHLRVAAAPSLPAAYNAAINGIAVGPAAGSCGTAAYRREPIFVDDIPTNPLWADYKDLAADHGLRACWSTPIVSPATGFAPAVVLGTFACYARQAGFPDPELITLLARAENLIRIALESERADNELRRSEARFSTFVDHATDAFFLLRQEDGVILDVNDEACRSLGYTRDELLGAQPTLFCNRGSAEKLAEDLARAANEEMFAFDGSHQRKDGTTFPVEVRIRPIDFEGRSLAVAFARDMTDRVRVENALRESDAFLRMTQRDGRVGNWAWNFATNRVKWSEGMARLHGIRLQEFDGSTAMAACWVHQDDYAQFQKHLDGLLNANEFPQWEYRIRRADGAIRYLWPTAEVIRDASGRPTEVFGVSIDITERVQAQAALRESEQRFRQLAEAAFEGLAIHENGLIRDANQAFAHLFGYESTADMIGKFFWETVPLTSEAKENALRNARLPSDKISEFDVRLTDGRIQVIETQARDIVYHGRPARVVAMRNVTERKSREQSLLLFRTLIDRLDDAIEVIDAPTGRFLDVNDRGCLDLGYSREELLSMSVPEVDTLVTMEVYQEKLERLRKHGSIQTESVHRRRDGSCFPVEIKSRLVQLDREYMLAVVRDVSERVKYEKALRDSEERFRSAFDFSAIGMGLTWLDGRWLKVNQSLCEIVGYTSDELLAIDFQSITHPDDLAGDLLLVDQLIAGSIPYYHLEKRYIHKQGHVVWSLLSVSLVRDADGKPLYFIGQMQDITKRKAAERQLAETSRSREELLALLDTLYVEAPVGLAFANLDFRYVRCNDALAEMNGIPAADHLGKTVAEIVPQIWPKVEPSFRHVLSGKGPVLNREIVGQTAARPGVTRHWLSSHYPVSVGAELIGIGIFVYEITEQRRLEGQIRQSHKMEAVGRLAGGIAHDFNNLLTVVNGHSQLLLDRLTPGDAQWGNLSAIHEAGQRAATLVRQLLAFSRGQELQPVVLDLNQVIVQSASLFRRILGKQIRMILQLGSDLAAIRADRSQMEQVLMNLVVNARDSMALGGTLTIQTTNRQWPKSPVEVGGQHVPGKHVCLSVTDTGEGMNPELQAKIFEPFFTTKDVDKGTGLGLSVVHGIVQQSGGRIEVESQVGVGSRIAILLPAEPD